jgi:hypothetical protein
MVSLLALPPLSLLQRNKFTFSSVTAVRPYNNKFTFNNKKIIKRSGMGINNKFTFNNKSLLARSKLQTLTSKTPLDLEIDLPR